MREMDDFDWRLTCIPDKIEELEEMIDEDVAAKLDGSLASLDVLEGYLLKTYEIYSLRTPENTDMLDRFASYVGEVAGNHIKDGVWDINTTDKKDVNYNFPVLKIRGNDFNPFTTVTASLHRKTGTYIRECVEVWI